jgi:hypothetical protein
MDKPITVSVPVNDMMEVARIFPSGRCKHLRYVTPNDVLACATSVANERK